MNSIVSIGDHQGNLNHSVGKIMRFASALIFKGKTNGADRLHIYCNSLLRFIYRSESTDDINTFWRNRTFIQIKKQSGREEIFAPYFLMRLCVNDLLSPFMNRCLPES